MLGRVGDARGDEEPTAVSADGDASETVPAIVRLDERYVAVQRAIGGIVTAIAALNVAIAVVVLLVVERVPLWVAALVGGGGGTVVLLIAWFSWSWPEVERRHTSYHASELGIEIRRGVFWRKRILVPRARVQHSDVSQGPIQRRFGLATLHLYTAGTEHSEVEVPGLSHGTALVLRDRLAASDADDAV